MILCARCRVKILLNFLANQASKGYNSKTFVTKWLNLIAKNYLLISQTAVYKLSFNKYKKISCQDTSLTDTLKIIYPASQTARGHIINATFLFSFGRIHHTKLCVICSACSLKTCRHNKLNRYVGIGQTFYQVKSDLELCVCS